MDDWRLKFGASLDVGGWNLDGFLVEHEGKLVVRFASTEK
jgi:hypothetical protein